MFAFCIWDRSDNSLFLARDRLGVKPLYYYHAGNEFMFSSEIKAIRKHKNDFTHNSSLIDSYMTFGYVPGEDTLLNNVKRMLPGHYAILKDNNLDIVQYWDVNYDQSEDLGEDYYVNKLGSLLDDSLSLRLRSDVPLGVFLSGGLDSSCVVALLADKVNKPIKTFSVAYDFGQEYNETRYARIIAKKFNTDHHETVISPNDFMQFIPQYIYCMDEPVTESAAISLNYVSKLASDHVTVVLSGEGSDEIFAGYDLYKYMLVIEKVRKSLGSNNISAICKLLKPLFGSNSKISKYLDLASYSLEQRYRGISTYENRYKDMLYSNSFKNEISNGNKSSADLFTASLFRNNTGYDCLSKMLNFDVKTWLVDDLLIKADRMSMASSLELRVPFLDYRLVEEAAKMPSKYKIKNGEGKYILKKMMENKLPKEIIYRKKMGFPTPLKIMFESHLKDYAFDTLLRDNSPLHDYFSRSSLEKMLIEHSSKQNDHHRTIWQMIVLQEWLTIN